MNCRPIRMKDGAVVLAMVKPGEEELTEKEVKSLAAYVQFCRDRSAKRKRKLTKKTIEVKPA